MSLQKRLLQCMLLVSIVAPFSSLAPANAATQERDITVIVNGTTLSLDVAPVLKDNHVYVPLRAVFEAHGIAIKWDHQNQRIDAVSDAHTISYSLAERTLTVDGAVTRNIQSITVNQRTLVPLRVISEALQSEVRWDQQSRLVTILKSSPKPTFERTVDLQLQLTAKTRSKSITAADLYLKVEYYGVKNNLFYTSLTLENNRKSDTRISFAPGDQKIIANLSKKKTNDPMPQVILEDCSRVENQTSSDGLGHIYTVPHVYMDTACMNRNAEKNKQVDDWFKNNWGFSEIGSDTFMYREEIQAADGSLTDYLIPAKSSLSLIIQRALPADKDSTLALMGQYSVENATGRVDYPITLEYAVDKDMGLGEYDFYFTGLF